MKFSHTIVTSASPAKIWSIWTDVNHWSEWDTELDRAYISGEFVLGAQGKLIPKTGPVSKFTITQFNLGISYTFTLRLLFCSLRVHRYLNARSSQTSFTHEVSFQGLFAPIFGLVLGRKFRLALPNVMEKVKRIAEG